VKHLYLFGILLTLPFVGFSQGQWNNWYFGTQAGVTFNSGPPQYLSDGTMYADRSLATVSDSLGNLLFFTDGVFVYDRTHAIMPNGSGLLSRDQDQSVYVIQSIGDDSLYYIFTLNCNGWPPPLPNGGLHYTVVNMRLNGGFGDVVAGQKNILLLGNTTFSNAMTAARHHNNKDVWLIVNNVLHIHNFYAFLITSSGIQSTPVISPSIVLSDTGIITNPGFMRVSHDGTKLISPSDVWLGLEYCHFNSTTGQIMPLFDIHPNDAPNSGGGWSYLEFSIDSRYLYRSTMDWDHANFFQYDASLEDSALFKQSEINIGHTLYGGHLQMGPDWKIYGDESCIDSLCVIKNPTVGGNGCNFQANAVFLDNHSCGRGLPQFLQKYYAYIHHSVVQCPPTTMAFTSSVWPPADSIHWDFGDPGSGLSNYSNLPNPSHNYSNYGIYTVELFVRHIDKRTDTTWQTLTLLPYLPILGPDKTICNGDSVTFDAGACTGCTYQWKNLGTGLTVGTGQTYRTGLAGVYAVSVTNSIGCIGHDTVQLTTTPIPAVTNNPLSKSICSGESTNIPLTSSVPGTNFSWTASLTSGTITGFSADSGLVINQVLSNPLATPGIVTYHITPKVGNCTGSIVNYAVTVNPGDSVKVTISVPSNNVCAGTPVTFTATPTNPGVNPIYLWKVNGIISGTNLPTFNYTPLNNDAVTCQLTSSNVICTYNNPASSNSITMTVSPVLPVSITTTASQNPFCSGSSVTFTAVPVNGGATPIYQWKVNGVNAGTNSNIFTYNPANGDQVTCLLISSEPCTSNNPASSISIIMIQNNSLPASVSIASSNNPFCPGTSVTFTATPINGGPLPGYQWKVNGINVGTNSVTYSYNPANGDSVRCIMTSNLACVTGSPCTSSKIIMNGSLAPSVSFTACFDTITTLNAKPIKLKGGIPLGGSYSGPGVNSGTGYFNPALAGVGTKIITYSYTNNALCTATKSISIINYPLSIFNCGNPLTDIRDNKTYQTVQIGSQCWLSTNLNFGNILSSSQDQRDNCIAEKYCYNDNPVNCTNHGGLYQWDELMLFDQTPASQGFCPPGWHIPSENDWNILFASYINNGFAGSPLKYSGFSGFNALLSGTRHMNKGWDYFGFATFFWSSTLRSDNKAWAHGMNEIDPSVSLYPASRVNAFSVRCLKD
jgi:uncharacterized protein (TIGR02145 family)